NLNTGPGTEERISLDPAAEPGHWFVVDLAIARSHARPILGPLPAALIGSIPRTDVLAALTDSLDWHSEHEGSSANAVLNACRAWRYALTGAWSTKTAAAEWALERGADRGLIDGAVELRAGAGAELDGRAANRLLAQV